MTPEPVFLNNNPEDLAWVAFRYADGNLEAESEAAFEQLLENHQSAREALADAVLLAGSVAVAVKAERRGRRRALFAGLAAAALVVFGAPRLLAPLWPAVSNAEAVALAWSGLRGEAEPTPDTVPDESFDRPDEPSFDSGDAPPGWLLEAAALSKPDDGRGS